MSEIRDDKAQHVVPFILSLLSQHQTQHANNSNPPPFFIGLNGVQGAGKSVLVDILKKTLSSPPHNLSAVVFSLDDLYLTHGDQVLLAQSHPDNPLLQHRGQPSTHDVPLGLSVFASLKASKPTKIPQYNKAAFSGQGDRVPESEWEEVNTDPSSPVRVVLFEGWSVGFRPLSPQILEAKHAAAVSALQNSTPSNPYKGRLGHNTLKSVMAINDALRTYDELTSQLDAFIHIDAADPLYVYKWRLEQEANLRASRGSGMTDEQVKHFVDGYYPAYELYTDTLRDGVFKDTKTDWQGRQLRLIVGQDRKVKEVVTI
ncbi:glycerate kinase [Exophiala viscosa]|uniref:Glycerate kinase n=1 Tax=Exophiala viscosa TaxID=2486360 RepID=A0AAN6IIU5_9EURO|nr:glycerate kinase [Exophiala viscosa]